MNTQKLRSYEDKSLKMALPHKLPQSFTQQHLIFKI